MNAGVVASADRRITRDGYLSVALGDGAPMLTAVARSPRLVSIIPAPESSRRPVPLTELDELAPVARDLVSQALQRWLPDQPVSQRFHRVWSGGWRVRVEIGRPPRGKLDFVLFRTPAGGVLALPHPIPPAWRDPDGVADSEGVRWRWSDEGEVELAPSVSN